MTRKLFAVASACAFLGAALAPTPSFAGEEQGQMRVATGDLNLQSDPGAQSVLRRIKSASSVFCENGSGTRDLARTLESWKCRDRMMYLAVSKLDAPLVTASYRASGAKPPILLARR
jgi:UrcA family protein